MIFELIVNRSADQPSLHKEQYPLASQRQQAKKYRTVVPLPRNSIVINRTESALIAQERRNQASKNPKASNPKAAKPKVKKQRRTTH